MADTTRRLGLHVPTGGDPADVPADMGRLAAQVDGSMLTYDAGTLSGRPAAGVAGRFYFATDVGASYLDTGTEWVPVAHQPGDIAWTARTEASRLGWLPCDGREVSRTTYAALFAAIGTTYGAGDGRTSFRLPDLSRRVVVGPGGDWTVGDQIGSETHRLTLAEIPSHTHTASTSSAGAHSHGGQTGATNPAHAHQSQDGRSFLTDRATVGGGVYDLTAGSQVGNAGGGFTATANISHQHSISTDGTHTHTVTIGAAGGSTPHSIVQPGLVLRAWIKV